MAAARAAGSIAQGPLAAVVRVVLACFSTPRATMHICADSTTTSTACAPSVAATAPGQGGEGEQAQQQDEGMQCVWSASSSSVQVRLQGVAPT